MFDGSTGGRGFENAATPWIWGLLAIVTIGFWLWFKIQINKSDGPTPPDDDSD